MGELCPADNPLKMINDYPFEMSNFEMMLSLKWYMTVFSKEATAPSILLKWYMYYPFEMTNDYPFKMSNTVLCSFRYDIWLSFRNDRAKFSYTKPFSSTAGSQILVTKIPLKPHIFVQRFFRSALSLRCVKIYQNYKPKVGTSGLGKEKCLCLILWI